MATRFRALLTGASAVAALGFPVTALAQSVDASAANTDANPTTTTMTTTTTGATAAPASASVTPVSAALATKPGNGFIGVNIGKATYGTSCGVAGLTCQNNVTSYTVTAGNMFTRNFGAELSLLNFGTADRANGRVTARGINLSAVGRLPLGEAIGLEGKVGTTYGITHVSAPTDSGIETGRAKGFGFAYGVGLDVAMTHGLHGEIGWEQHDFHFAGQGDSKVRNITVGLAYTF